jgi:integrase
MYLTLRYRTYWAFHDLPPKLAGKLGLPRKRFSQNLRTRDHGRAKVLAAVCQAQWLARIEAARTGDDLAAEAAFWRHQLTAARNEYERQGIMELVEGAADLTARTAKDPEADRNRFLGLATGALIPFGQELEEHLKLVGQGIEAKSLHMKETNLRRFASIFEYTSDVERSALQAWVNAQAQEGTARATLSRAVGDLRGYWKHLVSIGVAKDTPDPFSGLVMAGAKRAKKSEFASADAVRLEATARIRNAQDGDFVLVAMYTGARAEEIATLKAPHVDLDAHSINMPGTKTESAPRVVPIHAKLLPVMRRLVKAAKGGYLFPGWRADKFGDRSKAATKRVRGDIRRLGFGKGYDFHSIRRTVCTIFEDTGVAENVVAHIVGHKLKTMSYGLYSGGPSLAVKAKAIAKLRYPLRS